MSDVEEIRRRELTETALATLRDIRAIADRILDAFSRPLSLDAIEDALDEIHELACSDDEEE